MLYFLYKTTNKITGHYYYGKHETQDINDGYLGSGLALQNAIRKYGRENFDRQILQYCDSREELNRLETLLVTEEVTSDRLSYNIALGGQGGCIVLHESNPKYEETCWKIKEGLASSIATLTEDERKARFSRAEANRGKKRSEETKRKMSESAKKVDRHWLKGRPVKEDTRNKLRAAHIGKIHSAETIELISANHADVSGSNNPMFGKKHSEETIAKQKLRASQRQRKTCVHCGMHVVVSNHNRWHGDKCKNKSVL